MSLLILFEAEPNPPPPRVDPPQSLASPAMFAATTAGVRVGAGLFGNCQTASDSQEDELRVSRSSTKSKCSKRIKRSGRLIALPHCDHGVPDGIERILSGDDIPLPKRCICIICFVGSSLHESKFAHVKKFVVVS